MSNLVDANEEQNKIKIILLRVKYNNTLSWRVNFVIKSDPGTLDEALISRKILDILIGYFFSKSKIKRKTLYTFIKNAFFAPKMKNHFLLYSWQFDCYRIPI